MPATEVFFYQDEPGDAPVVAWLRKLRRLNREVYAKCVAVIQRLEENGHELRRPAADYLRDGIYELRVKRGHVNYRMLYFFHGRNVAVLTHALTKEDKVLDADIGKAVERKKRFELNPEARTYAEEI